MRNRAWALRFAAVIAALAVAMGLAACGDDDDDGGGGEQASIELRLGYVTPPAHPYGQAVDFFVEEVRTASDGRIEISTLPSYQGGDVPLLEDIKGGAIEMGSVSTATWSSQGTTAFDALQAIFLITRYDLEEQVITGDIGADMLAQASEEVGVKALAIHEGGLRKPYGAKKPLVSVNDFRGTKLRSVESNVLSLGLSSLGADPVAIPIGDVYNALRDGTTDGMEANLGLIQTFKFYEVAKFVTANVNFWPFPTALVMNQEAFDQLSDGDQQIIEDAAAKVPGFSIDIFEAPSDLPQTLCDEGVRFATSTDAQVEGLQRAGESSIAELSQDSATKDYIERIRTLKDELPDPPAPAPLPEGCTVGG